MSVTHRQRALQLLNRYLTLGPNAVKLSLLVGITPYIIRLITNATDDSNSKQILVSIWALIIGYDSLFKNELVREKAPKFFIVNMASVEMPASHRCLSAFVLSEICNDCYEGKQMCLQMEVHRVCESVLNSIASGSSDIPSCLKIWTCLCISKLCEDFSLAKYVCLKEKINEKLYPLLSDTNPKVRSSAALGSYIFLFEVHCLLL
jgi:regulator-associated protein of mTOR